MFRQRSNVGVTQQCYSRMADALPSRNARRIAGSLTLLVCLTASGCSGSAHLEFTALNFRSIDPPPPYSRSRFDHCYWWTDDQERVWIAMERRVASILGEDFTFEFQLSLLLERLPAGRARNYTVGQREFRALARVGPLESRFTSSAGIVALYRASGDRLRGSLRLQVVRRSVNPLLGGWSRPARYLIAGTLEAVHDERRGRAIVEKMEHEAFDEALKPPASRPSENRTVDERG